MKKAILLILPILFLSCDKKEIFAGPNSYSDSFEGYTEINETVDGDNINWSFFQKTYAENELSIDTTFFHSGNKSFKSFAVAGTSEGASKASINKQFMAFWEDETVVIDMWYYVVGTENADWMFLFDIEEKTAIGAGPGMRLALVDNFLRVEHKYPNPDIKQELGAEVEFPRDQWVNIRFESKLSQKNEGSVKVWQDDVLIIEQYDWKTLPKDILYATQGTKGMYSQIEFGVTANASDNPMTVYVDDISVSIVDLFS
ncbi:MAG: hypothetical protein GQ574_07470 [Crocinitomix sp.]|nr:hypothetical protein [Crocinitomix sp.]